MGLLSRRPIAPPPRPRALTASAARVNLGDATEARRLARRRESWQEDGWLYRDSIPEIRYAIDFLGNACAQLRLVPAVADPDGGDPIPLADAGDVPESEARLVEEALARLSGGAHQWGHLLEPLAENLEVAGECYLVGMEDSERGESWTVCSVDEVVTRDERYWIVDDPSDRSRGRPLAADDFLARIWHPHPRYRNRADSPMRALVLGGVCEELLLVGRMIRNASRNRLAGNGILYVHDSIMFPSATDPANPADPESDPFMDVLVEAIVTPIGDETSATAVVPLLVRGSLPADEAMAHITLDRPLDASLMERQEKALKRVGMGLDTPPEVVTGMAGVNHWTSWAIDESTFRHHMSPLANRMVDGLTVAYLRPSLEAAGLTRDRAARYLVWRDPSALVQRPNRGQDAVLAHDRFAISDEALVEALDFDPGTDMPDEKELLRRIGQSRGAVDPPMTEALLQLIRAVDVARHVQPNLITVETGEKAHEVAQKALETGPHPGRPKGPTQGVPAGQSRPEGPPRGQPPTPRPSTGLSTVPSVVAAASPNLREGRRLLDIDRGLRERLMAACDAALRRAIERASNRVRSRAKTNPTTKAVAAAASPRGVVAALGPAMVAALGLDEQAVLDGAWADLEDQWNRWTGAAREQALTAAAALAGLDSADPQVQAALAALRVALERAGEEGWTYLQDRLQALATEHLYAADPATVEEPPPVGEVAAGMLVPAGVVAGALALAGGLSATHPGITADGSAAAAGAPVTGLATGGMIERFLEDAGLTVAGYEWVYGNSTRHFEPHLRLDGARFADFGDPVLANPDPSGFPFPTFAPGDHAGCQCMAQPIFDAKEVAA